MSINKLNGVPQTVYGEIQDIKTVSNPIFETSLFDTNSTPELNFDTFKSTKGVDLEEIINSETLKKELKSVKEEQGLIGKLWDGFKNLTHIGAGSNKAEDKIKQYENGEISYEEAKDAIDKYKKGQEMCTDVVADIASGIVAVGAFALAVPTGGASLAVGLGVATAAGAGVKIGVKAGDAMVGGREYTGKDLLHDAATGAINGVLAPVTNGIGASVTKTIGKKLGLTVIKEGGEEIIEQAAKQGIKQGIKSIITQEGVEVVGGTLAKRALATGAGMAVDGAIGGAADNMVRAALDGEDVLKAGIQGAVGGLIMAPVIGGGFKIAGKAGKALAKSGAVEDGIQQTNSRALVASLDDAIDIDGIRAPRIDTPDVGKFVEIDTDDITRALDAPTIKETPLLTSASDAGDVVFKGVDTGRTSGISKALSDDEILELAGRITPNADEQKLIATMIKNETVFVDEAIEKEVMQEQFSSFLRAHPDISPDDIYIYSPQPKGKVKSYTRSGEVFAQSNGINPAHISSTMADFPEGATVFIPDDCSITGASMVFDLLETLPQDFKGQVVFAPTVKGSGVNLKNEQMADYVLDLFSEVNGSTRTRADIVDELIDLISDGKKDNIGMLQTLLDSKAYGDIQFFSADGSKLARSFANTDTFAHLSLEERQLADALFTASGLNKGYHSSGTMVLLSNKTPNNNVGIMEIYGDALGLATKPNGALRYSQNIDLIQQGKTPQIALLPNSNNHGNFKELIIENLSDGSVRKVPFSNKTQEFIDIVVELPNGELRTLHYSPRIELKSDVASGAERLFGLETDDATRELISILKGEYQPKSIKPDKGFWVDVLALQDGAQIRQIGA